MDKMAVISPDDIFRFSWMNSFVFWLKFHWSLFLRVQLTISSFGLDNGLAPNRRQAIIWTNADPIHWRIYAAPGGRSVNVSNLCADSLLTTMCENSYSKFLQLLSFTVISDKYTCPLFQTKLYSLSTFLLTGSFAIQWLIESLVNLRDLEGIVRATVYNTEVSDMDINNSATGCPVLASPRTITMKL